MASPLFLQPLAVEIAQLLQPEALQKLPLFLGELSGIGEPGEQLLGELQRLALDALKHLQKGRVEGVIVAYVLHAQGPREVIEAVQRRVVEPEGEAPHQPHPLLGGHRHLLAPKLEEEVDEHRAAA